MRKSQVYIAGTHVLRIASDNNNIVKRLLGARWQFELVHDSRVGRRWKPLIIIMHASTGLVH